MAQSAVHGPTSGVFLAGNVLDGKYRIERVLAEGGVGIVLLATQLQLDRPVAIKLLRPHALRNAALVAHFEREGRLVARIKSEHVVRIHDVGTRPDLGPYMVMEYLEGEDLNMRLEDGPLELEEAVDFVLQACDALAEAHSLQIVHRDLKPANLFLASRPPHAPILKIIDFGISKIVPRFDTGVWATSEPNIGTPAYMSPEQITSEPIGARADIWALGVVLYELLTGKMPFPNADPNKLIKSIIEDRPVPITSIRPDLPPALDAIIGRCLEKDPTRRFANVARFARELVAFGPASAKQTFTRIATIAGDPGATLDLEETSGSATNAGPTSARLRNSASLGQSPTSGRGGWGGIPSSTIDPSRHAPTVVVGSGRGAARSRFVVALGLALVVGLVGIGLAVMAVMRRTAQADALTSAPSGASAPLASTQASSSDKTVPTPPAIAPAQVESAASISPTKATTSAKRVGSSRPAVVAPRPTSVTTSTPTGKDRSMFGERK